MSANETKALENAIDTIQRARREEVAEAVAAMVADGRVPAWMGPVVVNVLDAIRTRVGQ